MEYDVSPLRVFSRSTAAVALVDLMEHPPQANANQVTGRSVRAKECALRSHERNATMH
jgi:hypothetical protein